MTLGIQALHFQFWSWWISSLTGALTWELLTWNVEKENESRGAMKYSIYSAYFTLRRPGKSHIKYQGSSEEKYLLQELAGTSGNQNKAQHKEQQNSENSNVRHATQTNPMEKQVLRFRQVSHRFQIKRRGFYNQYVRGIQQLEQVNVKVSYS